MTVTPQDVPAGASWQRLPDSGLAASARDHLWMHFTRHSTYERGGSVPVITRGEGAYIWDDAGKRYLDGLSGLFVVQAGHGRHELAEAAAQQAGELAFFPIWSYGTPQGALSITGIPDAKKYFEPLVPGAHKAANTNFYRAPEHGDDLEAFGRWAADQIEIAIEMEGADTVAAVFVEPVQNSGGCFPPPPGYFTRLREICDRHDVLLVSDEVICAFGRLGTTFACDKLGYVPDIITCAKGLTSGYSPIGAMIASERLFEPFKTGTEYFAHGYTFGGHPVSAAVAMENLDIFDRERLNQHVLDNEKAFRTTLERLLDLPIVGDVRGDGYFYGIELVKDKATKTTFDADESERLLRGFLSKALFDGGLYCRADDRGDPVIQLAPPLGCDQTQFDEIEQVLRSVLTTAWTKL